LWFLSNLTIIFKQYHPFRLFCDASTAIISYFNNSSHLMTKKRHAQNFIPLKRCSPWKIISMKLFLMNCTNTLAGDTCVSDYSYNLEVAIERVGFGFGSDGSGRFDFLEEIRSGRVGSIYMLCFFFRFLIDFNWIEEHLISDRIGSVWLF
jgi:hypothetical protein